MSYGIHGNISLNELDIVNNNVSLIRQIQQGGLIGEDIVVYDMTEIPVAVQR